MCPTYIHSSHTPFTYTPTHTFLITSGRHKSHFPTLDQNLVPAGPIALSIEEEEATIEKKSVAGGLSKELTSF